eukprot:scaffold350_cov333-Pavlova_lutheri.AAC.46
MGAFLPKGKGHGSAWDVYQEIGCLKGGIVPFGKGNSTGWKGEQVPEDEVVYHVELEKLVLMVDRSFPETSMEKPDRPGWDR